MEKETIETYQRVLAIIRGIVQLWFSYIKITSGHITAFFITKKHIISLLVARFMPLREKKQPDKIPVAFYFSKSQSTQNCPENVVEKIDQYLCSVFH